MTRHTIVVNGETKEIKATMTVAELVSLFSPTSKGIAVAIDRTVIPRSQWSTTTPPAHTQVEIVSAAAGG